MAELSERKRIYYIPDNYIEEGKILQGSISVKNLIQGIVIGLPLTLIGWTLGGSVEAKIILAILFGGPTVIFGIAGLNGDSLFTVAGNFRSWQKSKGVELYNPKPTPFYVSPTDTIFATELTRDKLVGAYEDRQKKRIEDHMNMELIEGKNFEFASDPTIRKYHNKSQKPLEGHASAKSTVIIADDDGLDELFGLDDIRIPNRLKQPSSMGDDDSE